MRKEGKTLSTGGALSSYRTITVEQMIRSIREGHKNRERFCFVLGAGASVESGIPNGQTMGFQWMQEIMMPLDVSVYKKQAEKLYENGKITHTFDQLRDAYEAAVAAGKKNLSSELYFDIYMVRFFPNQRNGYFALEREMEKKTPSIGYHPLVKLLADEDNDSNLVVTTNFDTLVEDALSMYTEAKPLAINHEGLATFAGDPNIRRPIIAKIHRGIFFAPLSQADDMNGLKGDWSSVLSHIFNCYTPIIIGYGGGDHSLMDFLKQEEVLLRNGLYWCYYAPGESPSTMSQEIQAIVEQKNGYFVETQGFDATLWSIGEAFDYPIDPDQVLDAWAKQQASRISLYKEQRNKIKPDDSTTEAPDSDTIPTHPETSFEETPSTPWEFSRQGDTFRKNRNYKAAIEAYTHAIELDDTVAIFYYWRAFSYRRLNKLREAVDNYTQAIALAPDDKYAYNNRGDAYDKLGEYENAIADYTQAIALDSSYATAYNNRGFTYKNMGRHEDAISDYSQAIACDSGYAYAYNNRGVVLDELGRYEEAIADYTQAIALDSSYTTAYNNRGVVLDELGRYEEAIADYTQAIALDSSYAKAYNNRGFTYKNMGRREDAISDYTQAIACDSGYAKAYNNRGAVQANLERYEEAITDYTQAIALNPDYAKAYNNRGASYHGLKRYEDALADYTKAIALDSGYVTAYENRALTYRALKQEDLAKADEVMVKKLQSTSRA